LERLPWLNGFPAAAFMHAGAIVRFRQAQTPRFLRLSVFALAALFAKLGLISPLLAAVVEGKQHVMGQGIKLGVSMNFLSERASS